MSMLETLGDDAVALLGCAAALIASIGLMGVSYYLRNLGKPAAAAPDTVRFPQPAEGDRNDQRRAA